MWLGVIPQGCEPITLGHPSCVCVILGDCHMSGYVSFLMAVTPITCGQPSGVCVVLSEQDTSGWLSTWTDLIPLHGSDSSCVATPPMGLLPPTFLETWS